MPLEFYAQVRLAEDPRVIQPESKAWALILIEGSGPQWYGSAACEMCRLKDSDQVPEFALVKGQDYVTGLFTASRLERVPEGERYDIVFSTLEQCSAGDVVFVKCSQTVERNKEGRLITRVSIMHAELIEAASEASARPRRAAA